MGREEHRLPLQRWGQQNPACNSSFLSKSSCDDWLLGRLGCWLGVWLGGMLEVLSSRSGPSAGFNEGDARCAMLSFIGGDTTVEEPSFG